jgi:hypothetical protein
MTKIDPALVATLTTSIVGVCTLAFGLNTENQQLLAQAVGAVITLVSFVTYVVHANSVAKAKIAAEVQVEVYKLSVAQAAKG